MKKTILLSLAFAFFYFNVNAQPVGKKLQVVSLDKTSVKVTTVQGEMEMSTSSESYISYEIKSVAGKIVQLNGVLTRVKGSVSMLGNDINFDSNDPSTGESNPQIAESFKEVNKAKDFSVEVGKTVDMTDLEKSQGIEAVASSLFYPFDKSAKEGAKLSDSSKNENGSKSVTEYVLSKINGNDATVIATSTATVSTNTQNNGMDVKVNAQVSTVSTKIYDLSTGILKSNTSEVTSNGTNEVMGQSMPISMKTSTTITVQ